MDARDHNRSTPPASLPSSEGAFPALSWGDTRECRRGYRECDQHVGSQKAKPAFEHVERALAGNELEDDEKELNSALVIYPKSAVAWCLMGTAQALLADSHLQFCSRYPQDG
jgi:hypothetical protein